MRPRSILIAIGLVLAALGILSVLQGRGILGWPTASFMVSDPAWQNYGTIIAVLGLGLVLVARRLR